MIIKKNIQASEEVSDVLDKNIEDKKAIYGDVFEGKYSEAQDYIMQAIKSLTDAVRDSEDPIAIDSIANLSVVLLDLQGNK